MFVNYIHILDAKLSILTFYIKFIVNITRGFLSNSLLHLLLRCIHQKTGMKAFFHAFIPVWFNPKSIHAIPVLINLVWCPGNCFSLHQFNIQCNMLRPHFRIINRHFEQCTRRRSFRVQIL